MTKKKSREQIYERISHTSAMADIREVIHSDDVRRRVAHEATLQLKMSRGKTTLARAATERFAASLSRKMVDDTVIGLQETSL